MSNISKLQELYNELDRLKESGEDVVADIRAEINNLELQILKDEIFPNAMLELANQLSAFRCTIDTSFQFDGNGVIDYTFCKSGTMSLIREKVKGEYNPSIISKKENNKRQKQIDKPDIHIEKYSEKSIAVYGDTKPFAEQFKKHGGYFNYFLKVGPGWIFSINKEEEIRKIVFENMNRRLTDERIKRKDKKSIFSGYDINDNNSSTERIKIKVTFPDGRVVCDNKVLNTLLAVIDYAGVEKIVAYEIKGGIKKGQPLIDKNFDPKYGKAIKSLGNGWYINTCSDTQKKFRYIKKINDKLNLNLTVELV